MTVVGSGLENSWSTVWVDKVEMEPSSELDDNLTSPRLAFCNITLEKKLGLMLKKSTDNTIRGT